jgi:hypothetical protein
VRVGIPKKGQAQTFLGKRGNMECVRGKEKNVRVNFEWKITWHMVLERIFEATNIVPRGQSTTSCISEGARVSQV